MEMHPMKRFVLLLIVTMMMAAGCGSRPAASPASAPVSDAAPPPAVAPIVAAAPTVAESKSAWYDFTTAEGERLLDRDSRRRLTLVQLRTGLEQFLNAEPAGALAEKLAALRDGWYGGLDPNVRPRPLPFAQADLDGDGRPEVVMVVSSHMSVNPDGAIFVAYQQDGRFHIEQAAPPPGDFGINDSYVLLSTANLTGQTGADVVWAGVGHGAHTQYAYVFVSRWAGPGHFENLPGRMYTSFPQVQVQGKELLLMGGETGSAGAGMVQRGSSDHYAWDTAKGEFRLVDREYEPSEYAYHRLLDGINAEAFGHPDKAEPAYRSALEPGREPVPDVIMPDMKPRFGPAMRAFAAFRLHMLLQSQGRTAEIVVDGPFAGLSTLGTCEEAAAWGVANPDFFTVMNALMGYRNITWTPGNLCGALPPDMK
jgi:hypothetical protein